MTRENEDVRPVSEMTDAEKVEMLVAAFGPESLDNADDENGDDQEDADG